MKHDDDLRLFYLTQFIFDDSVLQQDRFKQLWYVYTKITGKFVGIELDKLSKEERCKLIEPYFTEWREFLNDIGLHGSFMKFINRMTTEQQEILVLDKLDTICFSRLLKEKADDELRLYFLADVYAIKEISKDERYSKIYKGKLLDTELKSMANYDHALTDSSKIRIITSYITYMSNKLFDNDLFNVYHKFTRSLELEGDELTDHLKNIAFNELNTLSFDTLRKLAKGIA